ncbi:Uncharacterized protein conserved in bacteria (DUF2263), putative [Angomonas deanei]|uniref:Uncharacterized protein conserved in bacteria (DUF2263), putative n=1 Tax=Angomonas deanei TaxID=59799 RepID=A0A7G2CIZ3_9TRYP|nr:Uncharacterized protein conserved in bacteria (DUF2263), putative [Angomonas deanei]
MNRSARKKVGEETLEILKKQEYLSPSGLVSLREDITKLIAGTKYIPQEASIPLSKEVTQETIVEVTGESSLQASKRLYDLYPKNKPIACLNFASAHNPGGGFLSGSLAQEESLAANSALYASQTSPVGARLYDSNGRIKRGDAAAPHTIYKGDMTFSPNVPVFRDEFTGSLLATPYYVSFISAPAPNAGATLKSFKDRASEEALKGKINAALEERIRRVLSLSLNEGHQRIVLGAYGCGVFRNDIPTVVQLFSSALNGEFKNLFEHIVFAVYDPTLKGEAYKSFKSGFPDA